MSPDALQGHIYAAHGRGAPVIVRIAGPNVGYTTPPGVSQNWGQQIKQTLDAGADGIIVPQVRTVEEVECIVADCRYPTGPGRNAPFDRQQGGNPTAAPSTLKRGFGPGPPSNYGRIPLHEYLDEADRNIFVCLMCETAEMVDDIDAIVAVPGLDSICIGAMDLSASLGFPYAQPGDGTAEGQMVEDVIDRVIAACNKHKKKVGFSTGSAETAVLMAKKKIDWLNIGADTPAIVAFLAALYADIRAKL